MAEIADDSCLRQALQDFKQQLFNQAHSLQSNPVIVLPAPLTFLPITPHLKETFFYELWFTDMSKLNRLNRKQSASHTTDFWSSSISVSSP